MTNYGKIIKDIIRKHGVYCMEAIHFVNTVERRSLGKEKRENND